LQKFQFQSIVVSQIPFGRKHHLFGGETVKTLDLLGRGRRFDSR